jgi:hypothetical protein
MKSISRTVVAACAVTGIFAAVFAVNAKADSLQPSVDFAKDGGVVELAAKDGGKAIELGDFAKDGGVVELAAKDGGKAIELIDFAKDGGVVELAAKDGGKVQPAF